MKISIGAKMAERDDGHDEVGGAPPASRVGREVGQALGLAFVRGTGQPSTVVEIDAHLHAAGVCASCAGVRPTTMTSESGDGSAASPIMPARWPG